VKKASNGNVLSYWRTGNPYYHTRQLLYYEDGKCGSWGRFLADCLLVHGITSFELLKVEPNSSVLPSDLPGTVGGFLVKNWTFTGEGNSGNDDYPYGYPDGAIVVDEVGVPAQGCLEYFESADPQSYFSDHALLKCEFEVNNVDKTIYYDASYGKAVDDLHEWEEDAVDGFYASHSMGGYNMVIRKNTLLFEVMETLEDYSGDMHGKP
jgi:hypothetical protein